jgi:hypothetical protein
MAIGGTSNLYDGSRGAGSLADVEGTGVGRKGSNAAMLAEVAVVKQTIRPAHVVMQSA